MKKKRIFKRIFVFLAVLVGTLGICAVSGSIAKAASTDGMSREYFVINTGTHAPLSSEPNFTGVFDDLIIPFVFEHTDENTEVVTRYKSIYIDYNEGNLYAYFNPSNTELASNAVMFANTISSDWLMDVTIRTLKTQKVENVNSEDVTAYRFLLNNYGSSMIENKFLISGRYEFNDGVIENTFGDSVSDIVYNVRGYFASPMEFTGQELEDYFGASGLRSGKYYISSFRAIRFSTLNNSVFASIEFECYIPSQDSWLWINVLNESTYELADWANVNVVVFDGAQYVDQAFFTFLDTNGYFGPPIFEPDAYTPTDLVFAVVDAPIRFIQSLMSFELFGMGFFVIFASLITISIGVWIIFKKG